MDVEEYFNKYVNVDKSLINRHEVKIVDGKPIVGKLVSSVPIYTEEYYDSNTEQTIGYTFEEAIKYIEKLLIEINFHL